MKKFATTETVEWRGITIRSSKQTPSTDGSVVQRLMVDGRIMNLSEESFGKKAPEEAGRKGIEGGIVMAKKRVPMLNIIRNERSADSSTAEIVKDIKIKDHLTFDEMLQFVDNVVTSCFDTKTGEYRPEVMDFAIRINTLKGYTDMELPSSMDDKYEVAVSSSIVEEVLEHINRPQYLNIVSSIEAKVQNIADSHVNELLKQFDRVAESLDAVKTNMEAMFSGIDAEDISKMMTAFSDSTGWEDKLIKAYSEQKNQNNE